MWNLDLGGISILDKRIDRCYDQLSYLTEKWPHVSFRDISRFIGQITSMMPVLEDRALLRTRLLQTIVNIRNYLTCAWDRRINIGLDLNERAMRELNFWQKNLKSLNYRPFKSCPPSVIGWTDASAIVTGGVLCKLHDCVVFVACRCC